jgi:GNAT superfamily N-acetyltransferase
VIAAEGGNYFTPGVAESDIGTIAFLRKNAYRETASTWNLHVGIRDSGFGIRHFPESRITNPESLVPFVLREFNQAWAFEIRRAAGAFFIDEVGFAVYEANNRGLGTFGPMGVVDSMRGRGYGKQLLLASLSELRRLGYERAIIPWTDTLDFYRRSCGAEPAHRFLTFAKT